MFLRLLLGTLLLPILAVLCMLFAIVAAAWQFGRWLGQFPSWVIAQTVCFGALAALCFVEAVRAW